MRLVGARLDFLARFTACVRRLADLELPLAPGLRAAARDGGWRGDQRELIEAVAAELEQGRPLSHALAARPAVFDPGYRAIVAAAEEGSALVPGLAALDGYLAALAEARAALRATAVYPVVLLAALVAMATLAGWVVVPAFVDLVTPDRGPAPLAPVLVMWLSRLVLPGAAALVLLAVVVRLLDWRGRLPPGVSLALHRLELAVPVIGDVRRFASRSLVCRLLSAQLAAGVALDRALAHLAAGFPDRAVCEELRRRASVVADGHRLGEGSRRGDLFDPVTALLLDAAWGGALLPQALERIADHDARAARVRLDAALPLLEFSLVLALALPVTLAVTGQFWVYWSSLGRYLPF